MLDLTTVWLGNTLQDWSHALLLALSINLLVAAIKWGADRLWSDLRQPRSGQRDPRLFVVAMLRRTKQLLIFGVTLLIGTRLLTLAPHLEKGLVTLATVSAFLQVGLWFSGAFNFWLDRYRQNSPTPGAATSLAAVNFVGKMLLWTLILLLMLDNLGVNVTAMVAGLGVGGIAVALAVQNILGDLFASLSIVIDKPFVIGDVITVDSFTGSVEHVGLKTTRLRSSTGEQIIMSNGDLLKSRIRNFKRMHERRMLFTLGVVYQTSPEQLARIPGIIRGIIESVPNTRFERAHFKTFGPSSLDFEVVFWISNPLFDDSMDALHTVNLAIFKRFGEEGIEFAYPTQTMIVQGGTLAEDKPAPGLS